LRVQRNDLPRIAKNVVEPVEIFLRQPEARMPGAASLDLLTHELVPARFDAGQFSNRHTLHFRDGRADLSEHALLLILGQSRLRLLAQDAGHLDPSAAQALNALSNDAVATNTAGMIVFGIAAGLAVLRSRSFPRWLGWMAIAMAVLVVTPAESLSFVALVVWMVIVSILMWMRDRQDVQTAVAS